MRHEMLALAIALLGACAPGPATRGESAASALLAAPLADTVQGRVTVVAAAPLERVVLRRPGVVDLALAGEVGDLRRLSGVIISAYGRATATEFVVADFLVREVEGAAAQDGVLRVDDGALVLVLRDSAVRRIADPPEALRELAGARVWITGSPGSAPDAWGTIRITPRAVQPSESAGRPLAR
jgi:hypothetical protein